MVKNEINYLNSKDVIWVDILTHKYGLINLWKNDVSSNCSWFFRELYKIVNIIKPSLWIYFMN